MPEGLAAYIKPLTIPTAGKIALLAAHLATIFCVCLRETLWNARHWRTLLPYQHSGFWVRSEAVAAWPLFASPHVPRVVREGLATYRHSSGIEASYGYFGPSVARHYQIILRFDYADGTSGVEEGGVISRAGMLRLDTLLSEIGGTGVAKYREGLLAKLIEASWSKHPTATGIYAALVVLEVPRLRDYSSGQAPGYRLLHSYEVIREGATVE